MRESDRLASQMNDLSFLRSANNPGTGQKHSRGNLISLRDVLELIHIDLCKGDLVWPRESCCELFVDGRYLMAWSAPLSVN